MPTDDRQNRSNYDDGFYESSPRTRYDWEEPYPSQTGGAGDSGSRSSRYGESSSRREARADARNSESYSRSGTHSSRSQRDSAAQYSRGHSASRYSGTAAARRRVNRIPLIIAVVILTAIVIGAIAACNFIQSIGSRMNAQYNNDAQLQAVLAGQQEAATQAHQAQIADETDVAPESNWTDMSPFYMLLVGVDSNENRMMGDEAGMYGDNPANFRTDTIILVRVDPGNKKVTLVSIHRDTWIDIDGYYQKINNSYSLGGISKTIEVVSGYAGVPITHYAEVNLDGFIDIIDSLGGLWVDVPFEFTDDEEYTGAHFDAGPQLMSGEDCMFYVRVRHAYDNIGDGDRYRAANQRQVLELLLQRIMSASPTEMISIVNTMANYVSTDFTLDEIVNLALAMRGIDVANDVYSTMNPTIATYTDGIWYEISDDEYWAYIMSQVDAGEEPDADYQIPSGLGELETSSGGGSAGSSDSGSSPDTTLVTVRDASARKNVSTMVAETLAGEGWDATDNGPVSGLDLDVTVVAYEDERFADQAWQLAERLNGVAEEAGTTWDIKEPYNIMIVLGGDWG